MKRATTERNAALSAASFHPLDHVLRSQAVLPALLCCALILAFFHNLHAVPLFDVDEGAFSEATREMLARGDYVTTYVNGNLRFDKPILIYWLQALSASVLGLNEFAMRLPSALAGVGWISAILVFARQQTDRATGFAAALIGATVLAVGLIGRGAIADALLNLLLALTLFDIYRYMQQPGRKILYRAYLWMGLGLLTKGPIALLIPFAVSAMAFLLERKSRLWLTAVLSPIGWLILLAIAAPWYVLEYMRQGQAFIDGFFMRHNVERFQGALQGHGGGMLYYLPVALILLLPYSGLFLRVLPTVRAVARQGYGYGYEPRRPLAAFLWIWFLFVLAFFSLAGTKLPHYLLYGMTPLFVLMAMHRSSLRSRLLAFIPPLLLLCIVLALPALLRLAAARIGNPYFREMLSRPEVFGPSYYLFASLLLLAALALALAPRFAGLAGLAIWPRLAATGLLCTAAVTSLALPAIGELQQGPVKEAAAIARRIGGPVATWNINMPSFSFYLQGITKPYVPGNSEKTLVLTRTDRMETLGRVEILYRKGGIALVKPLP